MPTVDFLWGVTCGNSGFVAVGEAGVVLASADGASWDTRISETSAELRAVAYGNNQYVAVGKNGTILSSPDGFDWVARASGTSNSLRGIAFGNNRFVAVGGDPVGLGSGPATILISTDGVDWAACPSGTNQWFTGIVYGNGRFVAVGILGGIAVSPDGLSWTGCDSGTTCWLEAVAYGDGQFVAVGNTAWGHGSTLLTSADGVAWAAPPGTEGYQLCGIAYGNHRWVAVGDQILTSADGLVWSNRVVACTETFYGIGVAFGMNTFVVLSRNTILQSGVVGPRITSQPSNLSVSLGATAQFSARANSTNPPVSFQWRYEDVPLGGATNAILILTNVGLSNAGAYSVVVSDLSGTVDSAPVLLDVDTTFTKITADPLTAVKAEWHVAAVVDYNGDSFPDVYLHELIDGGTSAADYLFRNSGGGSFVRVTDPSLRVPGKGAMGPAWDDYDNDGTLDLFLPNYLHPNQLLRNRGDGTFESITALPAGESGGSSGAAWGDFDRDGYLDLFVGNGAWAQTSYPHSLYRNRGDGTFSRLTAAQAGSWLNESQPWGLASCVDEDDDGWLDLMVVSPIAPKARLYRNLGNGSFSNVATNAFCLENVPWNGFVWGDYDNDGRLDLFGAMNGTRPNVLYHNEGAGSFHKMTAAEVGTIASDWAFGCAPAWGDYDNDGFLDLFVPNGSWYLGHAGVQKSFLYHNTGDGRFTRIDRGSPPNELGKSWGAHWIDFNRDGFLDLFVSEYHAGNLVPTANRLYSNNRNTNGWLGVTCIGTASPRSGTGAKVRAQAIIRGQETWQLRLINSGGTSYGGQSPVAHFGLGDATNVAILRIEWTSGIVQELHNVAANRYLTVTEPLTLRMPRLGELQVPCWNGMICRVEVSPNLVDWTPVATLTNATGGLQWRDPDVPSPATRFYRARMQ